MNSLFSHYFILLSETNAFFVDLMTILEDVQNEVYNKKTNLFDFKT